MTICEKCRGRLIIKRAYVDFGDGDTEIEFEFCPECKIVYKPDIDGYEVWG